MLRFSAHEIINTHMMHIAFNYSNQIMSAPDLRVICFEEKIYIEFKKILKTANKRVVVQYDTTFNLTGYYASILNIIHPFLINAVTKAPPPYQ